MRGVKKRMTTIEAGTSHNATQNPEVIPRLVQPNYASAVVKVDDVVVSLSLFPFTGTIISIFLSRHSYIARQYGTVRYAHAHERSYCTQSRY